MSSLEHASVQNRTVLVRAFGDEPLKLMARGLHDGVVELDLGDATALFPPADVFPFDAGLFSRLRKAYGSGNKSELGRLWGEAARAA